MEYSAMKFRSAFALAILVAATTAARADDSAQPTAAGFWEALDDDGQPEGWFLFTDKKGVYSARLVKGFKKEGDDTPPKTICTECPGKKKDAHIMGLTLFWGMRRDGLNYSDGSVLDPRDGSVYHAKMWLDPDGQTLHVRGYLGISMFGKTQDWHRLPDDAMKPEDVPKEVLAGDEAAPSDKATQADKPIHAAADKAKHKKAKSAKAKSEKIKVQKAKSAKAKAGSSDDGSADPDNDSQ